MYYLLYFILWFVINEKLVVSGRVPGEAEITTFLTTALMEE